MAKQKPLKPGYVVPGKEKTSYAFGAMGQGMIYAMMSSYISDYYTNVLKLPLIFVLLLMLGARVWDAINDPLMGMLSDKRTTKLGKLKGYIVYAPYQLEMEAPAGEHELQLTVLGHRENAFGPVHNADAHERWIGPDIWRTTGAAWTDSYRLAPMGLLSAPVIEEAN